MEKGRRTRRPIVLVGCVRRRSKALAKRKKNRRGRKRKWRDLGPLDRLTLILRSLAWGGLFLVVGSVIWAGVYRFASPPGTLLMAERHFSGETIKNTWVSLDDVSPYLVAAVIAAEDTRFCLHNGIDFEAIDKALEAAENGKRLRGASTISQQTAKNAFLWNGRSWIRKGSEAWMTLVIETLWPKRRIMEVYINVAEWGDGLFGVEAAAQQRFGKSAKDLNRREAALLAAVLPNPNKWRVDPPGPYVRKRTYTLEKRMQQVRRDGLADCAY